jgi:glycosyltransferase involved in cell wall biosynthesis
LNNKKIIVSVISDLVSDQRVHRVCSFLHEEGYKVHLVGRKNKNSQPLEVRNYNTDRIPVFFKKGVLFYTEFNLKLLFRLIFSKADAYLSNDLDTLLPNFLVSRLKNKKLYYDTHEYFTGVPELAGERFKRNAWRSLEKFLLPRLQNIYTVNASVAAKYKEDYGVQMKVVRNLPVYEETQIDTKQLFPESKTILLLQGAGINVQRGAEELIKSMQLLPDKYLLYFIGSGDCWDNLKLLTHGLALENKVKFIEKVPFQKLREYTRQAHLGFSLDKPISVNYQLSLPNKIFDYLHAGVPVVASPVFEVKKIIETYNTGKIIDEVSPEKIAIAINEIFADPVNYERMKYNSIIASKELCWQNEKYILKQIYGIA